MCNCIISRSFWLTCKEGCLGLNTCTGVAPSQWSAPPPPPSSLSSSSSSSSSSSAPLHFRNRAGAGILATWIATTAGGGSIGRQLDAWELEGPDGSSNVCVRICVLCSCATNRLVTRQHQRTGSHPGSAAVNARDTVQCLAWPAYRGRNAHG